EWHVKHKFSFDADRYKSFLQEIGYLEPEAEPFEIATEDVDTEIAEQGGPQLVVPVNNARYALNAANARWGSLYDALYGTNAIDRDGEAEIAGEYDPVRGEKVIAYARRFLDHAAPLAGYSHADACLYSVKQEKLVIRMENDQAAEL